jgi:hypothetical protein
MDPDYIKNKTETTRKNFLIGLLDSDATKRSEINFEGI